MPLSHNTPRVGEWRGGQHPPLPRLPPALLLLGGLGPPSPFCCIPLLVFLGKGGGGVTSPFVPGDSGVGGRPVLLCIILLSLLFFLSPAWWMHCPQPATPQRGGGGGVSIKRMAGDARCPCTAWPLCCLLSVVCVTRQARVHCGDGQHPSSP